MRTVSETAIKCLPETLAPYKPKAANSESSNQAREFLLAVTPKLGIPLTEIFRWLDGFSTDEQSPFLVKILETQILREIDYICQLYVEGHKNRDLSAMRQAVHRYNHLFDQKKPNISATIRLASNDKTEAARAGIFLHGKALELGAVNATVWIEKANTVDLIDDELSVNATLYTLFFACSFSSQDEESQLL